MEYRLQVLTHGTGETLWETLASFEELVTPIPMKTKVMVDSGSHGFCQNTRRAWMSAAADSSVEYVFWLEHDFVFTRILDLRPLARVLTRNRDIAQMSLMRNPIREDEVESGGIYGLHRESMTPRNRRWLEHDICFTTNPSLMRRDFMAQNPWPDYPTECEGHYGADLLERGYRFGTWGQGETWVQHIGQLRTGHGY